MKVCESHHIEMRDVLGDNLILFTIEMMNVLLTDEDVKSDAGGSLSRFTNAIELEGGCMVCYYHAHFDKDLIALTKQHMESKP